MTEWLGFIGFIPVAIEFTLQWSRINTVLTNFTQGYDFKAKSWFSWPSPAMPIGEQTCMLVSNNNFVTFGGFRSPKSAQVIQ